MPDNIGQEQEKVTKPFPKKRIVGLLLMLVLCAAFLVIYQKYKMEMGKNAENEKKPVASIEGRGSAGNDLESLVLGLQRDRDRQKVTPVVLIEPERKLEVQPIVLQSPSQPVQIYVQAPKRKEAVSPPDEELVKIGSNLRQVKVQALQAPSYVGGFAAEKSAQQQQQQSGAASQQYNGSGAAGVSSGAINTYLSSLADSSRSGTTPPDQNKQTEKQNFLYSKGGGLTPQGYSTNIPIPQQFPLELKAGTIIPGIMISGLNSDLPGSVIGQVSEHIYDTATGQRVLIPKGSRLIGVYDSQVTYGQRRVGVVWNRVIAPDGTSLNISGSQGMDRAGYAGMPGRVDEHWDKLIGAALIASVFIGGAEMLSPSDTNSNNNSKSARDVVGETVAATVLEVGGRLLDKASNIQPTIKIRPGARFNVFVAQDIVFPTAWRWQ